MAAAFSVKQVARFHSMIKKGDGCWIWCGPVAIHGHGVFHYGGSGHITAHRAAWLIANGSVAEGFDVFRLCMNQLCVRPDHLRIGVTGSTPLSRQQRLERFARPDPSGCIIFQGSIDRCGYGKFDHTLAHRAAWEVYRGPIPEGKYVCHHCDNPPCINIDHLFIATQAENVADMVAKGRQSRVGAPKGHIGAGRKFTNQEADRIRMVYATGEVKMRQIALILGVDPSVVSRLINDKCYRAAPVPAALPT